MEAQAYSDKRWQFQWGKPICINMFDSACHWEADQRHNHSSGLEFFIVFLRLENIFPLNSEVLILMQPLRWFLFFQFFWDIFTLKCPLNTLISRLLHNVELTLMKHSPWWITQRSTFSQIMYCYVSDYKNTICKNKTNTTTTPPLIFIINMKYFSLYCEHPLPTQSRITQCINLFLGRFTHV